MERLENIRKESEAYKKWLREKEDLERRYARASKKEREDIEKKLHELQIQEDNEVAENRKKAHAKAAEVGIKEYKKMTLAQRKEFKKQQEEERKAQLEILEMRRNLMSDAEYAQEMGRINREYRSPGTRGADIAEGFKEFGVGLGKSIGSSVANSVAKLASAFSNGIDNALKEITSYQSKIEARLQGSGESFKQMEKDISKSIAASPFVSQKKMYENLSTLIDKGIAYNVEERAFLQTMTDKIVTTFDAFDSNLLRLIKLQQADITASRMGMEASLTKVFNGLFRDTSYLSDVYDTVSGAILEANSLLQAGASTSFEYNVQKWLGSLYSLGFSSDAISAIAQGINYLGTGNVSALSGNTALSSLFALSAARGGIDYGEALRAGLDGAGVNSLMAGMISYLKDIANNTDSKIIWSAYSNLFGMSVSDLKAIASLTDNDIATLMNQNMDYATSLKELTNQFSQLSSRMTQGEMINTAVENLIYTSAGNIASTPGLYATWLITSMIEDATGGTKIPSPFALGTGVNLPFTIEGLIKTGVGVAGLIGSIGSIISSLRGAMSGGMDWNAFDWSDTLTRGSELNLLSGGIQTGISMSRNIGSGSQSDMSSAALASTTSQTDEVSQITGTSAPEHDFDDLYKALFEAGEQRAILVKIDDTVPVRTVTGDYVPGAVKTTDVGSW